MDADNAFPAENALPLEVKDDLHRLEELMHLEFELLKSRNIEDLTACDEEKTQLLARIQVHSASFANADQLSAQWVEAKAQLRVCRDLHFRNLQLLRRQLDAVQGALQSLAGDSAPSTDTYNRHGILGRSSSYMRAMMTA